MNRIIELDLKEILSDVSIEWIRFKHKTVLITGANGMLPSYMVYALLYLNYLKDFDIKVIALVRNQDKAYSVFKNFINDIHLKFIVQDVTSPIQLTEKIDFIIHAASQASPKNYGLDPVGTLRANVIGTDNVLNLSKQQRCESFLFFSSAEIYGDYGDDGEDLIYEDSCGILNPLLLRSCYAESKRMGENMCMSWNFQYGIKTKIVRPFHTYGPCMRLDDGRVFADFCKNIVCGEDIVLRSDGSAKRAFCYITDAVRAYFKILLDGGSSAYNVGNPFQGMTIKKLAEILVSLYPEKKLSVRTEIIEGDVITDKMKSKVKNIVPSIEKIMQLGWSPAITVEEGFRRTISSILMEQKQNEII